MYKPTQPAALPYKGAPLSVQDIIQQQVDYEDRFLPHLVYSQPEEVMRKELPTQRWSPAARHVFGVNLQRFAFLLP